MIDDKKYEVANKLYNVRHVKFGKKYYTVQLCDEVGRIAEWKLTPEAMGIIAALKENESTKVGGSVVKYIGAATKLEVAMGNRTQQRMDEKTAERNSKWWDMKPARGRIAVVRYNDFGTTTLKEHVIDAVTEKGFHTYINGRKRYMKSSYVAEIKDKEPV
jgi:hypothetical protein